MLRYSLRRIFLLIPVIIGVTLLVYFILDLAPGDVTSMLGGEHMTAKELEEFRHQLGLDRPFAIRYLTYIKGLFSGDLGKSMVSGRSVLALFLNRLPITLALAVGSSIVSILISLPLGIYSAVHKGSIQDNIATVFAMLGLSMPSFWLGLILIIFFSLHLGWFPSSGFKGLSSVVLPAITLGTGYMATITRMTRSSMLDVIRQDYLRTARSKGAPEKDVIYKHALKNALIPIIAACGTQLGLALSGSVITENVFAIPGVGRLLMDSINQRDTPLILGCVVLTTIVISIVLLLVDLLYAVVDPRIKAQYVKRRKTS